MYKVILKKKVVDAFLGEPSEKSMKVFASTSGEEEMHHKIYMEGVEYGKRTTLEMQREEISRKEKEIGVLLKSLIEARDSVIKDAESKILELSLAIAKKIIKSEVRTNKDIIMNIIAESLKKVIEKERLIVKVSPHDFAIVKSQKDELIGTVDGIKSLEVVEDKKISQGGCVVESGSGNVDARIESQFQVIEKELLGKNGD